MSESKTESGGIGCSTCIGIVFLVLKILGVQPVANWSWIWVLCPFWIPIAIIVVIAIIAAIIIEATS